MFSASKNDETALLNVNNKTTSNELLEFVEPTMNHCTTTVQPTSEMKISLVVTCCPVPKDDCSECSCDKECQCTDCNCAKKNDCQCSKGSSDSKPSFFAKWFTCSCCSADSERTVEPTVEPTIEPTIE